MTTAPRPAERPEPASDTVQVLQAGLLSLFQMGLRVAAAATRLAEVEQQAADALAKAAVKAAEIAARQDSLAAATEIGHIADISEAARDMAAARLARITRTSDMAGRSVRKTAALALRLENPRAFWAPGAQPGHTAASAPERPAQPRKPNLWHEDLYERPDAPDDQDDDEDIGDRPTNEVLADIHRDLRRAMRPDDAGPRPAPRERPPSDSLGVFSAPPSRRQADAPPYEAGPLAAAGPIPARPSSLAHEAQPQPDRQCR